MWCQEDEKLSETLLMKYATGKCSASGASLCAWYSMNCFIVVLCTNLVWTVKLDHPAGTGVG